MTRELRIVSKFGTVSIVSGAGGLDFRCPDDVERHLRWCADQALHAPPTIMVDPAAYKLLESCVTAMSPPPITESPKMKCRAVGKFDDGTLTDDCAYVHGHIGQCDWAARKLTDQALREECVRRNWRSAITDATDHQLVAEMKRRELWTPTPDMLTDDQLRAEMLRRTIKLAEPHYEKATDEALRAECIRRFPSGFGQVHETTLRERDDSLESARRLRKSLHDVTEVCDEAGMTEGEDALSWLRDRLRRLTPDDLGGMTKERDRWKREALLNEKLFNGACARLEDLKRDRATADALARAINTPPDPARVEAIRPSLRYQCRHGTDLRMKCGACEARGRDHIVEAGPGIAAMTPNHPLGGDGHYVDPLDLLADDA